MATEVTDQRQTTVGRVPTRQITELIEVTIDTDVNGDGSISVNLGAGGGPAFAEPPWVVLDETSDPAASIENVSTGSLDIVVTGSATTGGTVTVRCMASGRQD